MLDERITRARDAIKKAGHPTRLADDLGVSKWRVQKWRYNGIPARFVVPVAELAGVEPWDIDPDLYPFESV